MMAFDSDVIRIRLAFEQDGIPPDNAIQLAMTIVLGIMESERRQFG